MNKKLIILPILMIFCIGFCSCASYFENRVDRDLVGTGGVFDVNASIAGQGVGIRFITGTFASRPVGSGDRTSFKVEEGVHTDVGETSAGLIDKRVTITQDSAVMTGSSEDIHGEKEGEPDR